MVTHTPHLWSCLLRFVEMWGENTSRSNGSTQLSRVSVTWSRRSGNSERSFSPRPMRMDIMNFRSNNICNAWFWVKFDLCSWTNFSCVNRTPCDRLVTSSCSNFLFKKKQTQTLKIIRHRRPLNNGPDGNRKSLYSFLVAFSHETSRCVFCCTPNRKYIIQVSRFHWLSVWSTYPGCIFCMFSGRRLPTHTERSPTGYYGLDDRQRS